MDLHESTLEDDEMLMCALAMSMAEEGGPGISEQGFRHKWKIGDRPLGFCLL